MKNKLFEKKLKSLSSKDFKNITAKDEDWKYLGKKIFELNDIEIGKSSDLVASKTFDIDSNCFIYEINTEHDAKAMVNMPKLLETLVEDAQWLNQDKHHVITFDFDDSIALLGVETEIKSACSNLLSNAIAYTQSEGKIHLSWQMDGDKAKFSVKDNGPGIQPEHVNRLTERFYRIDKSRSRDTGGSGLGLAIVKHVLAHHYAELEISSDWGKGSEFAIYFEAKSVLKIN